MRFILITTALLLCSGCSKNTPEMPMGKEAKKWDFKTKIDVNLNV